MGEREREIKKGTKRKIVRELTRAAMIGNRRERPKVGERRIGRE